MSKEGWPHSQKYLVLCKNIFLRTTFLGLELKVVLS